MTQEQLEAAQTAMPDEILETLVDAEISRLAKTGGRSHRMSVPPIPTDTDMLLSELLKRYKALRQAAVSGSLPLDGWRCGACGWKLTEVRPGKHQCDNPMCG